MASELIGGGVVGSVNMIHALNYTDYVYRPRRPEELDTAQGGGVVFNQAEHQILQSQRDQREVTLRHQCGMVEPVKHEALRA